MRRMYTKNRVHCANDRLDEPMYAKNIIQCANDKLDEPNVCE